MPRRLNVKLASSWETKVEEDQFPMTNVCWRRQWRSFAQVEGRDKKKVVREDETSHQ